MREFRTYGSVGEALGNQCFYPEVKVVEDRQGLKIACLEEIAFRMGYINEEQIEKTAHIMEKNGYGQYLLNLFKRNIIS